MEEVRIAKELADALTGFPESLKGEAFKILLQYRLGLAAQLPPSLQVDRRVGTPKIDGTFSEFFKGLVPEPKSNPERFASVAYYCKEYKSQPSVTQSEIIDTMHGAGLPPPKNFSRDIKTATGKRSALLMLAKEENGGVRAWQVTKTGEDFIRTRLPQS